MLDADIPYENLLDQLNDGLYMADRSGTITYWNRGAERITGRLRDEMVGRRLDPDPLEHADGDGAPAFTGSLIAECIEQDTVIERELYLRHKMGELIPVFTRISPIRNGLDEAIGVLEVFSDARQRVQALQRIEELQEIALLCPLTGVGNRRYADMALDNAFAELQRFGWPFGLLFLDIDHFKDINDRHGHSVGDGVLAMVAHALRSSLRSFDFVGRWGGEEFLVILPNTNEEVVSAVAERCRRGVEDSIYQHAGEEIRVTASMGAVVADPEESPAQCVARADHLMYRSKAAGRNRVTLDI